MSRPRSKVREPVQLYVDADDRALLDAVAARTGLACAEVLRRGLRAFAGQVLTEHGPGSSLDTIIGMLGEGHPPDLAARHDEYLIKYPSASPRRGRSRRR